MSIRLNAGAVIVAAGGDHQAELFRPGHVRLRLVRRVLGVPGLDAVEAVVDERPQLLPRDSVRAGMRDGRRACGVVDEADRLWDRQPAAIDPERTVGV